MYVSRRNTLLVSPPYHENATASLCKDDAVDSAEYITSSSSFTQLSTPSDSTFNIINCHHRPEKMTQRQQQQQQQAQAVAPFPNLPSQVSSASSLNSHASSNASTLTNLQHQAASSQVGVTEAANSSTMLNIPAIATSINSSTSLGLLANNYTNSIISNTSSNPNYNATAAALASASIVSGTVPEFLYQLTKMLTDPNNEIIEWSTYSGNGRIEVHNPSRLESEVLSRYFRHSKYSSFQRQLNYFGFRKIAGKGKMSPCSYVNDAATLDIRSLLLMKRKGSEKEKNGNKATTAADACNDDGKNTAASSALAVQAGMKRMNPGNDIQPATVQPMFHNAHRNISFDTMAATVAKNIAEARTQHQLQQVERSNEEFNEIKRTKLESSTSASSASASGRGYTVATGKGIRHQLNGYLRPSSSGGSINNTTHASTSSSSATTSATTADCGESSSNQNQSWSVLHNASAAAPTSTAPLQFLDPNELGMSVTSATYLNQLKNNYAAVASDATTGGSSAAVDATASPPCAAAATAANHGAVNQQLPCLPENSGNNTNTSPVSRVSSQTSFLGMLRRDDSLINLAMLPTLYTTAPAATGTTNPSNIDSETSFGFIDYNPS